MTDFLTLSERFRPISGSEADYQLTLKNFSSLLFPNYHYVVWDPRIYRPDGTYQQPDAFLIHREFVDWFVIEVELAHHPVSHIAAQLDTFATGAYGPQLMAGFIQREAALGGDPRLETLLLRQRPSVLCIINALTDRVREVCTASGAELVVAERFLGNGGQTALWLRHLPSQLGAAGVVGLWPLQRSGRLIGNRELAYLADTFPLGVQQLHLRYREEPATTCSVRELGPRRFVNLPGEWTAAEEVLYSRC